MKLLQITSLAALLISSTFSNAQKTGIKSVEMKTELDTVSRALGEVVAKNLMGAGIDTLSMTQFAEGMNRAFGNKVTPEDLKNAQILIDAYVQSLMERKAEEEAKVGVEFLAANAKKEGVVQLPSGLQYKIIKVGTGPKATDADKVTTHYTGTLVDGKIFDSSIAKGEPITFPVNGVIRGWTEALKLMPEGSTWQLFIPYDLAYGAAGRPGIPPYAVLIFELQLIDVVGR